MKRSFVFIILGSALLSICGCGNKGGTSTKEVNLYMNDTDEPHKYKVTFFNGNTEIPYLDIEASAKIEDYPVELNGNVFTIKNSFNSSSMTINGETGEVNYEDFAKFQTKYKYNDDDYLDEFRPSTNQISQKITEKSSYTKCGEYKLNLSDFNLKPIKYENKYYLPMSITQQLFCYKNGAYFLDSKDEIYYIKDKGKYHKTLSAKTSYSKAFYEYCFNEFSLNVELYYGLKGYSRKMRSSNTDHKYFTNGVTKEFEPYKEKIINSSSIKDFDNNLTNMLNKTMDDGGHTYTEYESFGNGERKGELEEAPDVAFSHNLAKDYKKKREESKDKDSIKSLVSVYDTDKDGKNDIGYLTFNKFSDETKEATKEEEKIYDIREIFRTHGANKLLNPNASDYDKKTSDIKDVIIDLSGNSGGDVWAEGFLLSWICGGVAQEDLKATNGKNGYSSYSYNYDVDGDGKYGKADYLPDTVNVYVLFSGITYSAANALVYNSSLYNRKQGVRKIHLMGSQSGGGACSITESKYLSSGLSYCLAYNSVGVDPNERTVCSENGVMPDDGLSLTYDQMVNRTEKGGINELVISKRAK